MRIYIFENIYIYTYTHTPAGFVRQCGANWSPDKRDETVTAHKFLKLSTLVHLLELNF